MTEFDDQPIVTLDEVYSLFWVWVGRLAGLVVLCVLAGFVWGSL